MHLLLLWNSRGSCWAWVGRPLAGQHSRPCSAILLLLCLVQVLLLLPVLWLRRRLLLPGEGGLLGRLSRLRRLVEEGRVLILLCWAGQGQRRLCVHALVSCCCWLPASCLRRCLLGR